MARNSTAAVDEVTDDSNVIWVMSNRQDDRVVLHEKDSRHPGGEAFVGGDGVDRVYRTARVEAALRAGTMVAIPEPPQTSKDQNGEQVPNRKYPIMTNVDDGVQRLDQPGQKTRLGRALDSELVPPGAAEDKVRAAQDDKPADVPVEPGTTVPVAPGADKDSARV